MSLENESTEQVSQADILNNEAGLLQGLLAAGADAQRDVRKVTIKRHEKTYFSFRIRPLSEPEYRDADEKATRYQQNKQLGVRVPVERNDADYRSRLIYSATVPEDRAQLWDNKTAWDKFNVLSGVDLIDQVLLPGEKRAVIVMIDELSGFGADLEETAKNS